MDVKQIRKNIKKWFEALNSGEYKQTKGTLERDGKYCCLGVANKVCNLKESSSVSLEDFFEKMGLKNCWGIIKSESFKNENLANMNDKGKSFKTILKFMMKYPEKVFEPKVAAYLKRYPIKLRLK